MFLEIASLFFLGHLHNAGKAISLGYGTLEGSYLLQVIPFPAHIEVGKCIFRDIYKSTIIMSISQRILFLFEIEVCQVFMCTLAKPFIVFVFGQRAQEVFCCSLRLLFRF